MAEIQARARSIYGLRLLWDSRLQVMAIVVLLGIALAWRGIQFVLLTDHYTWAYDFSAYWMAGRNLLEGNALYTAEQLAGPYSPQAQYLYLYPPLLAVLTAPIGAMFENYRQAAWVWVAIGATAGVGTVLGVARVEGIRRRWHLLVLLGAAFAMPPVVADLAIGNVHMLLLGLFALAWVAIRRSIPGGEVIAGTAIAVAALIKIFPALIVLWFLLTGRYRAAAAFFLAAGLLVLGSLPVTGITPWLQYPTVLLNISEPLFTTDTLAPAVWLGHVMDFTVARVLVSVAGLAILIWVARTKPAPISFAVTIMVSILIAPALYHHYLAITVLPLLIAVANIGIGPLLAVGYLGMFGGNQYALGDLAWIVNKGFPTIGALALLAVLLRAKVRPADGSEDAPDRLSPTQAA